MISGEFTKSPSPYFIVVVSSHDGPEQASALIKQEGPLIACFLWASDEPLGQTEPKRALSAYINYSDKDVVFVSTNAAMIFDATSNDVIDILELTKVQVLELRFIDLRLDRTLQNLYQVSKFPNSRTNRRLGGLI